MKTHAQDLAPGRRGVRRARCTPTRSTTSPRTCRSSRCSTCSTSSSTPRARSPIAFDSDCREGICGMCGLMINGEAHGPEVTTTCQLHMRSFTRRRRRSPSSRGAPTPFPVLKDLVRRPRRLRPDHPARRLHLGQHRRRPRRARRCRCPRTTPTAPSTSPPASAAAPASPPAPTARPRCSSAPRSPTSASCRRARPSATRRVVNMVAQHDHEGFGGCTNIGECTAACPKEIPLDVISQLNRDLRTAMRHGH